MGRPADAERLFREVLAADPHSATALTNLGVLYLSTERYDAAIDTLRRAIEADPGLAGPRNSLAVAYGKRGDLPRAVAEWQQALAAEPNRPDILYNLGTALLQLERRDEAVQILERFMAVAPGGPYATDIPRVRQMIERARRSDHAKVKGQRSKVKS
jgi:tetratricopeptide (TPR) repeat protein